MDGDEDTVVYQEDLIANTRVGGSTSYRRGSKDNYHERSFEQIENT